MIKINAYAAKEAGGSLEKFQYDLPNIGKEEVDINVHYCGVCHSDLSMINNDWGMTQYPLVPGHEIVGEVIGLGSEVKDGNGDVIDEDFEYEELFEERMGLGVNVGLRIMF